MTPLKIISNHYDRLLPEGVTARYRISSKTEMWPCRALIIDGNMEVEYLEGQYDTLKFRVLISLRSHKYKIRFGDRRSTYLARHYRWINEVEKIAKTLVEGGKNVY